MEANVSVDVGQNITGLLEKLATQIGTTVDKVFPWYVQQVYIEGWTTILLTILFLFVGIMFLLICYKITDKFQEENIGILFGGAGGCIIFLVLLIGVIESGKAISQIMNPNYHAMKMITKDVGSMVGGN